MSFQNIPPFVDTLVDRGIEPSFTRVKNVCEWNLAIDLKFNTKSNAYLILDDGNHLGWTVIGRYHYEKTEVKNLDDLIELFVLRYRQREFGSPEWIELAVEKGLLKREYVPQIVPF